MISRNTVITIASVIVGALILQVVLIIADRHETPGTAAVEFSKAYFKLDCTMAEYLCSEMTEDEEVDVVDDYLNRVAEEAKAMGFDTSWMKMALSHIEAKTQMVDDTTAEVHIICDRRRSINPVFAIVAKIFFLGETYKVDQILTVVKEDDGWKVCGQPFSLIGS